MNKSSNINTEKSFEYYMERLQQIVSDLQNGDLPLKESMLLYKEGLDCAKHCREYLEQAKKDVEIWQNAELKRDDELKVNLLPDED